MINVRLMNRTPIHQLNSLTQYSVTLPIDAVDFKP